MAKRSEKELADIKGIEQSKAIELAMVSKLYLGENEIYLLKKRIRIALKKYKYTLVDEKGKIKYFFKDVDVIALKQVLTKNGNAVLLINTIRLYDLKTLMNVKDQKAQTVNINSDLKPHVKQVIEANLYRLIRSEKEILQDLHTEGVLYQSIKKRWNFSLEKTFSDNGLFLYKGGVHYRIVISKMLICGNRVSSSVKGLFFPYHKKSNSYIINYLHLGNLLNYIKGKVQFFETYSRENLSYSTYKRIKTRLRYSLLLWVLLFCILRVIGGITKGALILSLEIIGNMIGVGILLIFFIRFIKLRRIISKKAKTPYHERIINLDKLLVIMKRAGMTYQFRNQFVYEHIPLSDLV